MIISSNTQSFTSLNGAIKVTKLDNTDSSSKKLSDAVSVNISVETHELGHTNA